MRLRCVEYGGGGGKAHTAKYFTPHVEHIPVNVLCSRFGVHPHPETIQAITDEARIRGECLACAEGLHNLPSLFEEPRPERLRRLREQESLFVVQLWCASSTRSRGSGAIPSTLTHRTLHPTISTLSKVPCWARWPRPGVRKRSSWPSSGQQVRNCERASDGCLVWWPTGPGTHHRLANCDPDNTTMPHASSRHSRMN